MHGTPAAGAGTPGSPADPHPPAPRVTMSHRLPILLVLVLAGLLFGASADAQVVRVTVTDLSGAPVPDAMVRLEGADGGLVHAEFTGPAGAASVRGPQGAYTVRVQRAGYEVAALPVQVARGETRLTVQLRARPLALDTVTVIAPGASERGRDAFLRRREMEDGVFLDPEYFQTRYSRSRWVGDLLRGAPGIETYRLPRTGRTVARNGRQWGCFNVLVDGQPYRGPGPMDNWMRPRDIVGVEIYHFSSDVPREYRRYAWEDTTRADANPCGLIIYWTSAGW